MECDSTARGRGLGVVTGNGFSWKVAGKRVGAVKWVEKERVKEGKEEKKAERNESRRKRTKQRKREKRKKRRRRRGRRRREKGIKIRKKK